MGTDLYNLSWVSFTHRVESWLFLALLAKSGDFLYYFLFFSGGNIKKCPRLQKLMVVSVECGISHNAMLERPHHRLYLIGVEAPTSTKEKQIS